MGYSIEVSFNVLKHCNVTEIKDEVENLATSCGCKMFYDDYEFENNHRKQCVITVGFDNVNICYLIVFLKNIRSKKHIYIENIYDDLTRQILYASKYYLKTRRLTTNHNSYIHTFYQKIYFILLIYGRTRYQIA